MIGPVYWTLVVFKISAPEFSEWRNVREEKIANGEYFMAWGKEHRTGLEKRQAAGNKLQKKCSSLGLATCDLRLSSEGGDHPHGWQAW